MDDKKTNMTFENAEKVFKRKAFDIFSEKIPGVYRDENGYIIVPTMIRKKTSGNTPNDIVKKESK